MSEFVYVIRRDDLCHKIGKSNDPAGRLATLQTGHSESLSLVAKAEVRDARAVEATAHSILRQDRLKGEWFRVTEQKAIAAVRSASRSVLGQHCFDVGDLVRRKSLDDEPSEYVAEVLLGGQIRLAGREDEVYWPDEFEMAAGETHGEAVSGIQMVGIASRCLGVFQDAVWLKANLEEDGASEWVRDAAERLRVALEAACDAASAMYGYHLLCGRPDKRPVEL